MTRAFLQFLADQAANWRDLAADMVLAGAFDPASPHEDRNPNVVRGKILTLNMLREIGIEDIQGFYRDQREVEDGEE